MTSRLDPKDRRELYEYFQHTIEGTYDKLLEEQHLDYKQNMLKSYLVESNIDPESLDSSFRNVAVQSIDYDLHEVVISKEKDEREGHTFYLDTQDSRFWTLYTLEKSDEAKDAVDGIIVSEGSGLDYLWFPAQFQRHLAKMGQFEGAGVSYEAAKVFPDEYIEENLPFGELSLQSSGHGTRWLLDTLSDVDLKRFLSLSSVRVRRKTEEAFVIERVDNKGRITTRGGDSIQAHLDFVNKLRSLYGDLVREIEEKSRISYPSRIIGTESEYQSEAQSIEGSPIIIGLSAPISNIEKFAQSFTSAKKPLRLWGAGTWLSDDYYKVRGTDLHNNDSFTLEIKPNWLRLYLPEGACGNTALRIFSNIQRYYDAEAAFGERSAPENTTVNLAV